nr:hypothetical protein [uncultured Blautia sp.]
MEPYSFLDEIAEEDSVQILKAALPYLPASGQSFISVLAKFLELQNTVRLIHSNRGNPQLCAQSREKGDPLEMLSACSKVCHGAAKERIDTLINAFLMIQMFELSQNNERSKTP